jgi:hypothetical protein
MDPAAIVLTKFLRCIILILLLRLNEIFYFPS